MGDEDDELDDELLLELPEGLVLLLDEELELDDVGSGSGPVSVGAAFVAYPMAQDSTFAAYSAEWLYRMTALTRVFSDMMSTTPEQRYRPAE